MTISSSPIANGIIESQKKPRIDESSPLIAHGSPVIKYLAPDLAAVARDDEEAQCHEAVLPDKPSNPETGRNVAAVISILLLGVRNLVCLPTLNCG